MSNRSKPRLVIPTPAQEHLLHCFTLHSDTGTLTRNARSIESWDGLGTRPGKWQRWNDKAGVPWGRVRPGDDPYAKGTLDGVMYYLHRIIFKMVHGYDAEIIHHVNAVKHDNRPANLQDSDPARNARERALGRNNKTGIQGGSYAGGLIVVHAEFAGQRSHVGSWPRTEAGHQLALAARKAWDAAHGFGPLHGRRMERENTRCR